MKKIFWFAFIVSALSLAAAFTAQYGFGLRPCELCLMQRVPYAAIMVISLFSLLKPYYPKYIACLIAVIFVISGSIATYHSGVEKHLIKGPDACTSSESPANLSVDELLKKIESAPVVACDQPAWEFYGITMAVLNAIWSFLLAVVTIVLIRRTNDA